MKEILAARIQKMNQEIAGLGSASSSQIEYEIRSRTEARLGKIDADARKHKILASLGPSVLLRLFAKAAVKGFEFAEIAAAEDLVTKRESLRERRSNIAKLSEVVSMTVDTIRQSRGIGGGA